MAELVVNVGRNPRAVANDGDAMLVFTDNEILLKNAANICRADEYGYNMSGYREPDTLLDRYLANTMQYRFQRDGSGFTRTVLDTMETDVTDDLTEYLNYAKNQNRHMIFGLEGSEHWYGGTVKTSSQVVSTIWDEIEYRNGISREQHKKFPLTDIELTNFIALSLTTASDIDKIKVEQQARTIRKRDYFIPYWSMDDFSGVMKNKFYSRTKVDLRDDEQFDLWRILYHK